MIDINIKMKTDKYNQVVEEFLETYGNLTKDTHEHYYTDGEGLGTVLGRCKDLMKKKWFRDNADSFLLKVDDEPEEDLIIFMTRILKREGLI